ncbi:hypothetical protein SASPL_115132 [Salvia splendens]|uniref:WRKY domain-containing protein n=1 Tax=Salvia splendens TaxID=180675 RepID=A0A8X9A006_SALSN|nr:hypothetical protein SASPL_115132 [Salvia splendens]
MAVDLVMNCRNSSFVSQSVDKFKKVMSFVGWARTGHARFRRAPFSRPRGREDLLPHPHPAGSGGGEHELLLLLCRLADFFFLRLQEEVLFVGKRHVLQEEVRGYYKCSSVRGCPARKHVERDVDDPTMLVVTKEGDHTHNPSIAETCTAIILQSS